MEMTRKYLVVLEKTATGYSGYSPDVPGCVATGRTMEEAETSIREAIEFHLEGMTVLGQELPVPSARYAFATVRRAPTVKTGNGSVYHVVPGDGQWIVKRSGATRASRIYARKDLAVQHGKALARKHAAQLVIHNRDGSATTVS
jgi:predicted RNase H-like HicB family nuclease